MTNHPFLCFYTSTVIKGIILHRKVGTGLRIPSSPNFHVWGLCGGRIKSESGFGELNSDEAVTGWKSFRTHDRFVQAIRGFLLGFRRSDSVASKTRAVSKFNVRSASFGESEQACVRQVN